MHLGITDTQIDCMDTTDTPLDPQDEFTLPPFDVCDFFDQDIADPDPLHEPFPDNPRNVCARCNNCRTVFQYIRNDRVRFSRRLKLLDRRWKYIGAPTTSSENRPQNFVPVQVPSAPMAEPAPETSRPKKSASARKKAKAKKKSAARSSTTGETPAPGVLSPQAPVPEALTPAEVYTTVSQGSTSLASSTTFDTSSYRSSHADYFSDDEEDTDPEQYNLLLLWLIWFYFIIHLKITSMKATFKYYYRANIVNAPLWVQRVCEFSQDCFDAAIDLTVKRAMRIVNFVLDAKMWVFIAWDILKLIKGRFMTADGNIIVTVGADRIVQFGNSYCENEHPELSAIGASLVQRHPSLVHSCTVSANNDITGLGIRYLVYITVFCRMFLASFANHYAAITRVSSQILANCSLLALAFCMFTDNISLPHSLAALQLAGIIIWPNFIIEPQRSYSPRSFILQQVLLNSYFIIGVWVQILAPCMGSDPQCSHLVRRSFMGIVYFATSYETRKSWVRLYLNLWFWNLWRLFTAPGIYVHMRAFVDVFSEEGSLRWAQEEKRRRAEFVAWHYKDTEDQPWWFQFGRMILIWAYVNEDCPELPWHVEDNTPFRERMANWLYSRHMMRFIPAFAMLIWLIHALEDLCNTSLDAEESIIANFGQIFAMAQALEMVVLMMWFLFYPERKGCATGCFIHRTSRECMHCIGKRKGVNETR
ncbi:hypothetical protein BZA77DRAFT_345879 [Pyronema omphalodes]|nr:hypothetical protein BZA77DRAFT_345879 [Pyronema omphalodes]